MRIHRRWVGDVLLRFDDRTAQAAGRMEASGAWKISAENPHLQIQPASTNWKGFPLLQIKSGPWQAWLLGELYGIQQPEQAVEAVLHNRDSAAQLNGHFALIAYNQSQDEWHIWISRFGSIHLYHAQQGSQIALSSFSLAAASVTTKQLDWPAITGFCSFGMFPQSQTYLENVQVLAPATHTVLGSDGQMLSQKRYWDWAYQPNYGRSYDDTVDEFADIFGKSMTELTASGRIALPISGGLDSRSTLAALPKGADVWAYSYGYGDDSAETDIASQLAKAHQLPFESFCVKPYLFDKMPQIVASTEGFQDITQARQATVTEQLRANSDYVIAAHWGDVWCDDMGLLDSPSLSTDSLIDRAWDKFYKPDSAWLLNPETLGPKVAANNKAWLRTTLEEAFAKVSHIDELDFRLKVLKTDWWSWRWTLASLRTYQSVTYPRLPFYDTRLADFFCTVPSSYLRGRQLQIDYIKRYAPHLARVRWQQYDANLYRYKHFNSWLVPARALKKARRLLLKKRIYERNWEVQFLNTSGQRQLKERLFDPGSALTSHVPSSQIASLLDQLPRDPKIGYSISMLLTLEAWLRRI